MTLSKSYGKMPLPKTKGGQKNGKDSEHLQSTAKIFSALGSRWMGISNCRQRGRLIVAQQGAAEYEKSWREFLEQYYYASNLWLKGAYGVEFPSGSFKAPLIRVNE